MYYNIKKNLIRSLPYFTWPVLDHNGDTTFTLQCNTNSRLLVVLRLYFVSMSVFLAQKKWRSCQPERLFSSSR